MKKFILRSMLLALVSGSALAGHRVWSVGLAQARIDLKDVTGVAADSLSEIWSGDGVGAESRSAASSLAGYLGFPPECVMEDGLRVKVTTIRDGLRCTTDKNGGSLIGPELALMTELFVVDYDRTSDQPQWYQCSESPRLEGTIGFLSADVVRRWPTRLGDEPVLATKVFATQEQADHYAKSGELLAPPIAQIPAAELGIYAPWPIAETHLVKNNFGQFTEVSKLIMLAGNSGQVSPRAIRRQQLDRAIEASKELALVFCVDNTRSTESFLTSIRQVLGDVASQLNDISLGMTLYRDDVVGLHWKDKITGELRVTKTLFDGQLVDVEQFRSVADTLTTPDQGSLDWPEMGFDGLLQAIESSHWPKMATPSIIWISDNSSKEFSTTVDNVIAAAKAKGVCIHALCVDSGGGEPEERLLHIEQCEKITGATGGAVFKLGSPNVTSQIVSLLQEEADKRTANVRDLERFRSESIKVQEYVSEAVGRERQRRLQLVQRLTKEGIVVEEEGNAPVSIEGWVANQPPNEPNHFNRKVFLSRRELTLLMSELIHLAHALEIQSEGDMMLALRIGLGSRVSGESFFAEENVQLMGLNEFLKSNRIPLRSGITNCSLPEIMNMNRVKKDALLNRVRHEIMPGLQQAYSSHDFFKRGNEWFGWIDEKLLP